jgi:MBG domain-containing protein
MAIHRIPALLIAIALVVARHSSFADNVTLAWNASTDPAVTSYNLYYGSLSQAYTDLIVVGTNTTVTVSNVTAGMTYFFAATAVDSNGLESGFSGELAYQVPLPQGGISIANLNQTYDGTPKTVAVITSPPGLLITLTYDGQLSPPSAAGSYQVIATIVDLVFVGSTTNTFTISPATASILFSNLNQVYDGTPKTASAATVPAGLAVSITYNDLTNPPTNPGAYRLIASILDPNYSGIATNILTIESPNGPMQPMVLISWPLATNEVTISQSTDLVTWTPLTTIAGPSSFFLVPEQSESQFFSGTQCGPAGTNALPLTIGLGLPTVNRGSGGNRIEPSSPKLAN